MSSLKNLLGIFFFYLAVQVKSSGYTCPNQLDAQISISGPGTFTDVLDVLVTSDSFYLTIYGNQNTSVIRLDSSKQIVWYYDLVSQYPAARSICTLQTSQDLMISTWATGVAEGALRFPKLGGAPVLYSSGDKHNHALDCFQDHFMYMTFISSSSTFWIIGINGGTNI